MITKTITYKVTRVEVDSIQVQYSDGSWAEVPVFIGDTEAELAERISSYNPAPLKTFDSVDQVPISVGYTGTVTRPEPPKQSETMLTYEQLREDNYPTYNQFIEASYAAKNGDSTALKAFYEEVGEVQEEFPETMAPISIKELAEKLSPNV
jgi:hypothetical protein